MRSLLLVLLLTAPAIAQEGFEVSDLSQQSAAALRAAKIPYRAGLMVTANGFPDVGAVIDGIRQGDILTKIGDVRLKDTATFDEWRAKAKKGEYAVTLYRRNKAGKYETAKVTIAWAGDTGGLLGLPGLGPGATAEERAVLAEANAGIEAVQRDVAAWEAALPKLTAEAKVGKEKWTAWEAEQAKLETRPYELKGDRLGMTLEMFKGKHFRTIKGDPRPAPFCSDSKPEMENSSLLYEPQLAKAGIVHARTAYPFEKNQPTMAGVTPKVMIYKFIDGKLYQIAVSFDHDGYQQVIDAMLEKYGEPATKEKQTYQNGFGAKFEGDIVRWTNATSSIFLMERPGTLERSMLTFTHEKLGETAKARTKEKTKADDL